MVHRVTESQKQLKRFSTTQHTPRTVGFPAMQEAQVQSLGWEYPLEREWLTTPVFLPREFHGQRSLVGYSPWGHKELDTTEQPTLSLFLSLS